METRTKSGSLVSPATFISIETQTDSSIQFDDISGSIPKITTRRKTKSRLCHPRLLQAGLLMMALCNESPNQAVMNMYIMDTVVYQQSRKLPLRLRKDYQRQLSIMKKYRRKLQHQSNCGDDDASLLQIPLQEIVMSEESDNDHSNDESNEDQSENVPSGDIDDDDEDNIDCSWVAEAAVLPDKIHRSEDFVLKSRREQKENLDIVLPDPRSIRYAHRVASSYLEGKIGEAMVKNQKTYLVPDGTSRSKVGKMGGCLVHIEGKSIKASETWKRY